MFCSPGKEPLSLCQWALILLNACNKIYAVAAVMQRMSGEKNVVKEERSNLLYCHITGVNSKASFSWVWAGEGWVVWVLGWVQKCASQNTYQFLLYRVSSALFSPILWHAVESILFPAGLLNFRNCLPLQMTSWDNLCSDCLKAWFLNAICELFEWCQVWIQIGSKYLSVCTVWHHYRFQMRTWYTHVNSQTALLLSSLLRPCMAGLFLPPIKILVLAHFL